MIKIEIGQGETARTYYVRSIVGYRFFVGATMDIRVSHEGELFSHKSLRAVKEFCVEHFKSGGEMSCLANVAL